MRARLWLLSAAFWLPAAALCRLRAFPLDDDWAYSEPLRRWLSGAGLRLSDWGAPTLLGHLGWGALFCLPAGFSYQALRLSTLVLAFAGLLAFWRALRRLGAGEDAALLAALVLLFNPLFFSLSFSFMTDVPCLAWMLLASLGYLAGEQDGSARKTWAGSAAAAAAYLVRQTGGCVPAFVCARLAWRGERRPAAYARAGLLPLLALAFHAWWLGRHGPPQAVRDYVWAATLAHLRDAGALWRDAWARGLGAALYLGLFCAPLAAAAVLGARERWRARPSAAAVAALGALALLLGARPLTGNVFGPLGVGVCTLEGCAAKAAGPLAWPGTWRLLDALAAASGLLLLPALFEGAERGGSALSLFSGGFVAAFLLSLAGRSGFDRYYLVLFPPALAALALSLQAKTEKRCLTRHFSFSALGLLALAWLSVSGTWDYLAWTQAKWTACERLVAQGVPATQVDGGFEWDALQRFERGGLREDWLSAGGYAAAVSFSARPPAPQLRPAGEQPYFSPLTMRTERLSLYRTSQP